MSFLRNLLANVAGIFISLTIIGILAIFTIAILSSENEVIIPKNSVLKINLAGPLLDRSPKKGLPFNLESDIESGNGLNELKSILNESAKDENIKAILIEGEHMDGGLANIAELQSSIFKFRSISNKPVFYFAENISQKQYQIALACDSILLHPVGHVEIKGLGAKLLYFKTMLDKIGIEAEPIRVGKFKSAVEPFILDSISPANKKQVQELLNEIWSELESDIVKNRSIAKIKLNNLINSHGYLTTKEALEYNFIDQIAFEDERDSIIKSTVGEFKYVKKSKYLKTIPDSEGNNKIAVVYAEGAIAGGCSDDGIAANTIVKLLDKIEKADEFKAVVIRINSPGGSAQASEKIWRKISILKKKKPVVVSMGNIAASGGYYIAMAADTVVAEAQTITGSIGVFGLMFNVEKLKNKIGITAESITTHELSDFPAFDRPLKEKEKERLTQGIEDVYKTFIQRVADGRNMSITQVEEHAQGRVWAGKKAKELGLVDEIGGLDKAIEIAGGMINSEVSNLNIFEYPKQLNPIEKMIENINEDGNIEVDLKLPIEELNILKENFHLLESLNEPKTQLPYIISID